jgi:hypothetical protein
VENVRGVDLFVRDAANGHKKCVHHDLCAPFDVRPLDEGLADDEEVGRTLENATAQMGEAAGAAPLPTPQSQSEKTEQQQQAHARGRPKKCTDVQIRAQKNPAGGESEGENEANKGPRVLEDGENFSDSEGCERHANVQVGAARASASQSRVDFCEQEISSDKIGNLRGFDTACAYTRNTRTNAHKCAQLGVCTQCEQQERGRQKPDSEQISENARRRSAHAYTQFDTRATESAADEYIGDMHVNGACGVYFVRAVDTCKFARCSRTGGAYSPGKMVEGNWRLDLVLFLCSSISSNSF